MLKVLAAVIVLLIIIGIALLGKKITRTLIFKTAKTPSNESIWIEMISAILVLGISLAHYTTNKPDATITMWIGALVFFLGGILQLIARKQLYEDKTFEQRLSAEFSAAQTGLYAKIRHPSKTALILIMTGLSLTLGSMWATGLLVILFLPSLLYRVSQEERALLDKFGDRWMDYQNETKKLIPGVF